MNRTLNKFRTKSYLPDDRNYHLIEDGCYNQIIEFLCFALERIEYLPSDLKNQFALLREKKIETKDIVETLSKTSWSLMFKKHIEDKRD